MSTILYLVTIVEVVEEIKRRIRYGVSSYYVLSAHIYATLLGFHADQLQGTLIVTLRDSPSGQSIDDNEVRRKFQQFGDVKSITPVNDRNESVVQSFRHTFDIHFL